MRHNPLIALAVGVAITLPLLYLVSQGRFVLAGLLVAAVFFLLIFRRLDLWWIVAVATAASNLHVLMTNASIHLIAVLGFGALGIMAMVMMQARSLDGPPSVPRRAAFVLLVVIVITASLRGWGLRIFGGTNWGGMQYVSVIATLIFYLLSSRVVLTEVHMWRTARALCLLGLIPAIAVVIVRYIPGTDWVRMFVQLSMQDAVIADMGLGETRWGALEFPAVWSGFMALLLFDRRFKLSAAVLGLALLSFVMLGLSGHRTVVVLLGLTVLSYLLIRRRSVGTAAYLTLLIVLMMILILVYLLVDYLPVTFQRAFAFLPGISVVHEAALTAESTTTWRIQMWKMILPMIPDYLWLGRGMGFNLGEAYAAYTLASDLNRQLFFIATHSYHNGPLWLLVDLGLAGFISATTLMFGGILHYKHRLREIPFDSHWYTIYVVFFCIFAASCVFFFVIIGSHAGLIRILIPASILEVIIHSVRKEKNQIVVENIEHEERSHNKRDRRFETFSDDRSFTSRRIPSAYR